MILLKGTASEGYLGICYDQRSSQRIFWLLMNAEVQNTVRPAVMAVGEGNVSELGGDVGEVEEAGLVLAGDGDGAVGGEGEIFADENLAGEGDDAVAIDEDFAALGDGGFERGFVAGVDYVHVSGGGSEEQEQQQSAGKEKRCVPEPVRKAAKNRGGRFHSGMVAG